MRMSSAVIAGMLLISEQPVLACTMVWVPYLQSRPKYDFAVKAKYAWVEFTTFEVVEKPWSIRGAGVFHLRGIRCLSRPKGEKVCPTDLDIPFDEIDDGANCGFYPSKFGPDKSVTDRYFYLRKIDQSWSVTGGARRLKEL
jgi:hypothetical protein